MHITRREFWADAGDDIGADEWRAYCLGDPALGLVGSEGSTSDLDDQSEDVSDLLAEWTHPSPPERFASDDEPYTVPFDFWRGSIVVKNPDAAIVQKMCQIADALDARVQGDDGEIYRPDGSTYDP
ncbi:MAG: hypothetical protein AAFP79_14940 [Pseudomonadota bacterium]